MRKKIIAGNWKMNAVKEEAIALLKEQFHLQVIKIELLKGYDKKADTMFAALLKKPL